MAVSVPPAELAPPSSPPAGPGWRKFWAIGTGAGIEIAGADLRVTAVKVRPHGASILGFLRIAGFRQRPATEWGGEYAAFLNRAGAGHVVASVLLPRREVIVRTLAFPGVRDKDLAAALRYQIDGLHPYPEDEVAVAWSRLPGTSTVIVALARTRLIDDYSLLFAEAGIPVACFTVSPAVLYPAARLFATPSTGKLLLHDHGEFLEAYGESESRPLFSGVFDCGVERGITLALSELRLPPETEAMGIAEWLPRPRRLPAPGPATAGENPTGEAPEPGGAGGQSSREVQPVDPARPEAGLDAAFALSYAAALTAACPRLALDVNLLPLERRASSSRMVFVPTLILGLLLAVAVVTLLSIRGIAEQRYLEQLNAEIARIQPRAAEVAAIDREMAALQKREDLLQRFRLRSAADLEALRAITKLLAPPAWLESLQMGRTSVQMTGQAEQAAPLLKLLDQSPLFHNSQFSTAVSRIGDAESFTIRMDREGPGTGEEPVPEEKP